jgi:3-dehydroquinate dehydratase-1
MKFPETHPAILGTVTTPLGLRCLAREASPVDAMEVRVDALLAQKVSVEKIEAALKKRRHPVLLTLRIPAEGGQHKWKIPERRELFLRLLPQVEAIDVELATARAMQPVIDEARRRGKTVVLSAHAIKRPATPAQIARWVGEFDHQPRTILKIAAQIKSWRDLQQLAALLVNHPDWPIAAMGLGPYAPQSRSILTALGSRLVYGYLDQPAAPGQPSAAEVRKMVKEASLFNRSS